MTSSSFALAASRSSLLWVSANETGQPGAVLVTGALVSSDVAAPVVGALVFAVVVTGALVSSDAGASVVGALVFSLDERAVTGALVSSVVGASVAGALVFL